MFDDWRECSAIWQLKYILSIQGFQRFLSLKSIGNMDVEPILHTFDANIYLLYTQYIVAIFKIPFVKLNLQNWISQIWMSQIQISQIEQQYITRGICLTRISLLRAFKSFKVWNIESQKPFIDVNFLNWGLSI